MAQESGKRKESGADGVSSFSTVSVSQNRPSVKEKWAGTDFFAEVRDRVPAIEAARRYGATFDHREEKCLCQFHNDHHASMTFRDGRFRCWSCGASGDSVDYVGKLFGLSPLESARKVNADFGLNLEITTTRQTQEQKQAAQQRQGARETWNDFRAWAVDFQKMLSACIREGNTAMANVDSVDDLKNLTDRERLAVVYRDHLEWLSDTLAHGEMAERVAVFNEREGVERICQAILKISCPSPLKSAAG